MSGVAEPEPAPPTAVLIEFLHALTQLVGPYDRILPVLRGSTLMNHWFGGASRPAADIDLEWFAQPGWESRFASPIEHARGLCMFAVGDHSGSPISFDPDIPIPGDGVSLWEYDTPGLRCYTGWTWAERGLRGVLQVDIAQAGSYDLAGVVTQTVELPRARGNPAHFLAYSPEMLLAAKLSWIVRHVRRDTTPYGVPSLASLAEPKDLFDAHLLLTKGRPRPEAFQNALLTVAMEDKLDWNQLDLLLDQGLAVPANRGFANWAAFFEQHARLIHQTPVELLSTVIAHLRELVGDLRQHVPFLRAIQTDPVDEVNLLIYSDWLEDHEDARAEFLRLFCRFYFHKDRPAGVRAAASLPAQPGGWLYHVLGGPERSRNLRKLLETL